MAWLDSDLWVARGTFFPVGLMRQSGSGNCSVGAEAWLGSRNRPPGSLLVPLAHVVTSH